MKCQQRAQSEDKAIGDKLLHALLQFAKSTFLRIGYTQIQTPRTRAGRINFDRVGAGDWKRLSRQIETATARENVGHRSAVRLEQRHRHAARRVTGHSYSRLLTRGAAHGQGCVLTRRRNTDGYGWSTKRDTAGGVDDVVDRDCRLT